MRTCHFEYVCTHLIDTLHLPAFYETRAGAVGKPCFRHCTAFHSPDSSLQVHASRDKMRRLTYARDNIPPPAPSPRTVHFAFGLVLATIWFPSKQTFPSPLVFIRRRPSSRDRRSWAGSMLPRSLCRMRIFPAKILSQYAYYQTSSQFARRILVSAQGWRLKSQGRAHH